MTPKRRALSAALPLAGAVWLLAPWPAAQAPGAAAPGRLPGVSPSAATPLKRVGILTMTASPASFTEGLAALQQGLLGLGWQEGKNIEYLVSYAGSEGNDVEARAAALVARTIDLLVTTGTPAALAARRATQTLPIVVTSVSNPVASGLVASLGRPGGNVTGLANQLEEAVVKQVELLHELLPAARRFAIVLNDANPTHAGWWPAMQQACAAMGLVALRVTANAPAQIAGLREQLTQLRAQAVLVAGDAMFVGERHRLHEQLQATRLPVAYQFRQHVEAGGLMSHGLDIVAMLHYCAKYVDKILRGAKPADLPVEQPTQFRLTINLRAAQAIGLTVPPSLLLRADEVIR